MQNQHSDVSPIAKRNPVKWLVASDLSKYDAEGAFRKLAAVDWSETNNAHIATGDTVFLYGSKPVQALTHECIVTRTGIAYDDDKIDDSEFWVSSTAFDGKIDRTWMRLHLVQVFEPKMREHLSLSEMEKEGLTRAPQGRMRVPAGVAELIEKVKKWDKPISEDAAAESDEVDTDELARFHVQMDSGDYSVADKFVTSRTRGSAQSVFAGRVKANYGYKCALTGISTKKFLVASHIVPWSEDENIRLDPSNGICLSTMVDRAFDTGYLAISEDFRVVVNLEALKEDPVLFELLSKYDGRLLRMPVASPPNAQYIARRNLMG